MRVDQVLPSLAGRDAIGVHTVNLRDALRAAGIDSDIYYGSHTPDVEHEGRPVIELGRSGRDRWLLYQASIGSPVFDILAARSEPKLVYYHNITPAELLATGSLPWPTRRHSAARSWPGWRRRAASPWPPPPSTRQSCRTLGYGGTAVARLLIDIWAKRDTPDPALARSLARRKARGGGADLLYVGKISPHKAPHDLVKMLDVLRRTDDPHAAPAHGGLPAEREVRASAAGLH